MDFKNVKCLCDNLVFSKQMIRIVHVWLRKVWYRERVNNQIKNSYMKRA